MTGILPLEIIGHVVDQLEAELSLKPGEISIFPVIHQKLEFRNNLIRLSQVSKDWFAEVGPRLSAWVMIDNWKRLDKIGRRRVHTLDLSLCTAALTSEATRFSPESHVYHSFLSQLSAAVQQMDGLKVLKLPSVPVVRTLDFQAMKRAWHHCLESLRDITHLDLGDARYISQWAHLDNTIVLLRQLPNLVSLKGVGKGHEFAPLFQSKLEVLEFSSGSSNIDDNFLLDLQQMAPNLHSFTLRDPSTRITHFGIKMLKLPLTTLQVGGGGFATMEGLLESAKNMNLKRLNLGGYPKEEATMEDDVPLQFLSIPTAAGVIGIDELKIVSHFRQLTWLDLSFQPWLNVTVLGEILQGCQGLQTLRCVGSLGLLKGNHIILPDDTHGWDLDPQPLLTLLREGLNPKTIRIVDLGFVKPDVWTTVPNSYSLALTRSLEVWLDAVRLDVLDLGLFARLGLLEAIHTLLDPPRIWPRVMGLGPMPGRWSTKRKPVLQIWSNLVRRGFEQGCQIVECVDGLYNKL
jgi:hypothetical protein